VRRSRLCAVKGRLVSESNLPATIHNGQITAIAESELISITHEHIGTCEMSHLGLGIGLFRIDAVN
jgi:hypothetical protein